MQTLVENAQCGDLTGSGRTVKLSNIGNQRVVGVGPSAVDSDDENVILCSRRGVTHRI